MSLCQYKNLLGVPGKGFHRHVAGFAIVDVLVTLAISALMGRGDFKKTSQYFVWWFILAQLLHWMFCVKTVFQVGLGF
jgi:hypothetical protein